jgi:hypothetical protein
MVNAVCKELPVSGQRACCRSRRFAAVAVLLLSGPGLPAVAAVQGSARALPYAEALARSRAAAEAVLARAGAESCLRGKLTNALLGLSASCEAVPGQADLACALAERAVVQLSWSVSFMEATARELLQLIEPRPAAASKR